MLDTKSVANHLKYAFMKMRNAAVASAVTESDVEQLYKKSQKSFVDHLPFLEYLDDSKCFLLEDGCSVAAVYTITPIATEGRSSDTIVEIRDEMQRIFQDVFVNGNTPWVIQQFNYGDKRLGNIRDDISEHIAPHAKGTAFTEKYLNVMEGHYQGIADNEKGIFKDEQVTNAQFRGQYRRCKLVFYRRLNEKEDDSEVIQVTNDICNRLESEFNSAGVKFSRDDGASFFNWLLDWFNPNPKYHDKKSDFLKEMAYPDVEERPYGYDLAESMIFDESYSDPENKCWWLNDQPTRFIRARQIRSAPIPGLISGELSKGNTTTCMMDSLPEGAMLAQTMVIQSQNEVEMHLDKMVSKSMGDTSEASRSQDELKDIKDGIGRDQNIVKASFGVYVRGKNLEELNRASRDAVAKLSSGGIVCYDADKDSVSTNAFLVHLPMAFEPKYDTKFKYLKHFYMQHMMNLSLFYGRSEGSGHSVINFWNRGGSPLSFDFMDKDRASNSHMLIGGPTGSGKSATLCYLATMICATIRPRLFIFELGNSFGLLGDYMKSLGLTVNKRTLKPGSGISLNPFSDSHRIVTDNIDFKDILELDLSDEGEESDGDIEEDDQRDIMGEMQMAALLMITGGERKEYEKLDRADRAMIGNAIRECALEKYEQKEEMLTEHLRDKLREMSTRTEAEDLDDDMRSKAKRMAMAIHSFCEDFDGEMFNTAGGHWEDVDVTILDLATYAKEGYEAQMALTYVSLMSHINALGEQTQHQDRKIVQITDEAHVVTVNELLAPYMVKGVKVQRKIGISSILATQNFTDFPNDAKKLLNMIDWWMCLCPTKDEIDTIARFKELTEENKKMMLSCKKQKRCYTEGVVLSTSLDDILFRNVPPSHYLAIAMTEKEEKAERRQLMEQHGITEVEAATMVGKKLDEARGIHYDIH